MTAGINARVVTLRGVTAGIPGAKTLILDDIDASIATLPGLIHYIDPTDYKIRGKSYRDRCGGAEVYYLDASVSWLASGGAAFANKPVLQFASKAGALYVASPRVAGAVTIPASYTVMFVASLDEALNAQGTLTTLAATYGAHTTGTGVSMRYAWLKPNAGDETGMGIQFYSRFENLTNNTVVSSSGFNTGAATARIWMFVYDSATKTSRLYGHALGAMPVVTKTDHAADGFPADYWIFMNGLVNSTTSGAKGKLGCAFIFDRALDTQDPAAFSRARGLLAMKYGIA